MRILANRLAILEAANRARVKAECAPKTPVNAFDDEAFAIAFAEQFGGMSDEQLTACFAAGFAFEEQRRGLRAGDDT